MEVKVSGILEHMALQCMDIKLVCVCVVECFCIYVYSYYITANRGCKPLRVHLLFMRLWLL